MESPLVNTWQVGARLSPSPLGRCHMEPFLSMLSSGFPARCQGALQTTGGPAGRAGNLVRARRRPSDRRPVKTPYRKTNRLAGWGVTTPMGPGFLFVVSTPFFRGCGFTNTHQELRG